MLHSTKGIVFHSIKYSETSVIVKIYTELFGIQSYLVKGVRNPRSKVRPGLFQPLTLLDLVVYHKGKKTLQSLKEIRLEHPYHTIPFDIRKSSVVIFLNELLYQSIREEESNVELFDFIWKSCISLDETAESVSEFHLLFALQLCRYLGIFPNTNYSPQFSVFNLREGQFQSSIPDHPHFLDPENSRMFYNLLTTPFLQDDLRLNLNSESRSRLLEIILLYYQLHLPGFKGLKSHHVLHSILS
ncbi:MAG: DNA repair protein RecO [Bacteroidales bacterium]|jgi:DNA repair protein RecO (recombination protein O)|nr:DNA repair protein RecO [Bacteroidales bacterium]